MSVTLGQGTQLFLLDSTDTGNEVRQVLGITSTGTSSPSRTKTDTTELDSTGKENILGLSDPGTRTFAYNFHTGAGTKTESQVAIKALEGTSTNYRWVLCAGDGTVIPTFAASVYTLPSQSERTYWDFMAGLENMTSGASGDDIYKGDIVLSLSGTVTESRKTS